MEKPPSLRMCPECSRYLQPNMTVCPSCGVSAVSRRDVPPPSSAAATVVQAQPVANKDGGVLDAWRDLPWPVRSGAWCLFTGLFMMIGFLLARPAPSRPVNAECPDPATYSQCVESRAGRAAIWQAQEAAERARAAEASRAQEAEQQAAAQSRAEYAKSTPKQREEGIRRCLATDCKQRYVDAIIDSGANEKERDSLRLVSFAASAEVIAKGAMDGTSISAVPTAAVALILEQHGAHILDKMRTTTVADAQKDSDEARGKVLRVSGQVVRIEKSGPNVFVGTLVLDQGGVAYFFTSLPTPGVYAGSWASYRGVFMQEYAYHNVANGQTRSLLIVGGFGQQ